MGSCEEGGMIPGGDVATLIWLPRSRPLPSRERWSARDRHITSPLAGEIAPHWQNEPKYTFSLVGEVAPRGRVRGETPFFPTNRFPCHHPAGRKP
jgi:hypothetical protein